MPESESGRGECIICKLLDGSEPASFVYRDDDCSAFMDIQPINAGHMLVAPNNHVPLMDNLPADAAAHLMRIAHMLAAALRESGLPCAGVNMFLADGEAAGQEVFHVHLHLFPRYHGDGFGLSFGPDYFKRERAELDEAAGRIRQALVRTTQKQSAPDEAQGDAR
jgi:histidine triad (HIT) family protein